MATGTRSASRRSLADDGGVPVLFGRAFLLVFTGKINLEIIIRAVKKYVAEIPPVVLLITMVKKFDVFFVGFTDKG